MTTPTYHCVTCGDRIQQRWSCKKCWIGPLCGECYNAHRCPSLERHSKARPRDRDEE